MSHKRVQSQHSLLIAFNWIHHLLPNFYPSHMENPAFMDDEVIDDSVGYMEQEIYSGQGQYNPPLDTSLPSAQV